MQAFAPATGPKLTYASLIVPSANAIDLPEATAVNVATVPLAPGQWLVDGEVWVNVNSDSPSIQQLAVALTDQSATIPTDSVDGRGVNVMEVNQTRSSGAQVGFVLPIAATFVPTAVPINYHLVAFGTWAGGGTLSVYGRLADRMAPNPSSWR
jgi:hypothetical protein